MARRIKKVPKVPISEPEPIYGRIAWWLENTLTRFVKRITNEVADVFKNILSFAFEETIDVIEDFVRENSQPLLNEMLASKEMPDSIKDVIRNAKDKEDVGAAVLLIPIVIGVLMAAVTALIGPIQRRLQYEVEEVVRSYRPPPETIMAMLRRNPEEIPYLSARINELGVSNTFQTLYGEITKQRMPIEMWGRAWLRDFISREEFADEATKRGVAPKDWDIFNEMLNVIPPVNDLVRMVVREAWDDTAARRFGYDDGDYSQAAEWAKKQGLNEEWMKRYWRSHWELPGVREGFEMFHRGFITDDDLELLLRLKDIPTFWRTNLTKLSYNVVTRVDIRRMYNLGSVSEEQVYDTYLKQGYSPEDAELLTEWTVREYGESNRDLAKGDVIGSYTDGIINEAQALEMLGLLGYDNDEIGLLLARADLKRQEKFEKDYVENVRLAYVAEQISQSQVVERLSRLNPPSGFIENNLQIWDLQRERGIKRPTVTNLKRFFVAGIITVDVVENELRKQKYPPEYINWFIQLWSKGIEDEE